MTKEKEKKVELTKDQIIKRNAESAYHLCTDLRSKLSMLVNQSEFSDSQKYANQIQKCARDCHHIVAILKDLNESRG